MSGRKNSQVSVVLSPDEQAQEKEKLLQIQPSIAQIHLRTLTSTCHSNMNRHAFDWGRNGLLAYASYAVIVILDPSSLQPMQTLDKDHTFSVTNLKWCKAWNYKKQGNCPEMMLASADTSGRILIWNTKSGDIKASFQDESKQILQMEWLGENIEDTGHLLLVLHPNSNLILWDTSTGKQIWKKTYFNESLRSFDMDPFDVCRLAFKTSDCILFVNDFSPTKCPSSSGKKLYVSGPIASMRQSPSRQTLDPQDNAGDAKLSKTKLKKFMKDFVLGHEISSHEQALAAMVDCQQVLFHQNARNHLILVFTREILMLDLDIGQTVGCQILDRSCSPILELIPTKLRDGFYLLLENGSLTLRMRKDLYRVASTPMILNRSLSTSSVMANSDTEIFSSVTEIQYEQKAVSESLRLSKHAKTLTSCLNPKTETNLAILASDGKVIMVDTIIQKKKSSKPMYSLDDMVPPTVDHPKDLNVKLCISGIMSNLSNPPFLLKMCPPLTTKNWPEYKPYMASGGSTGNIQILNMSTGQVEREFATHTFPVRGIEWTSLHSILSHAHQSLSGGSSNLVRNELNHTDIRTGHSVALRSQRSEEPPIDMIRVSHLKQYFIVSFRGAPFELWDLKNLSLLRTMPKKFPPITALEWSPLHNLKSLKKKQEQAADKSSSSPDSMKDDNDNTALIAKEHFVFTDPEGQLYHFSVEGNAIKDGTKVPAEASLSTITCISWKSDHIVRGDSEGNLNIWDVRTKSSRNITTKRGFVKKIRFAPGRGNMKLLVLHVDSVSIWDVKEAEIINELRSPKDLVSKPTDIEWAASDRPIVATSDGCLRIMSLALSLSSSTGPLDFSEISSHCFGLLPNKVKQNLTLMLHHQPWNSAEQLGFSFEPSEGLGPIETGFIKDQVQMIDEEFKQYLASKKTSTLDRCKLASQICGWSQFEVDFWTLAASVLKPSSSSSSSSITLDTRFDLASDCASYLRYQLERLHLHESKVNSTGDLRRRVIDQMLCLGLREEAVALLLESDPDGNAFHYEDNLRACLVSACSAGNTNNNNTTIKLVATNMIAEGKLWEGVELLCLIDKVFDACTYLQSCQHWDSSLWLAKCRLGNSSNHQAELQKVLSKYCDHCTNVGQAKRAILLKLGQRDYVSVLDILMTTKMIPLAAMFLQVLQEYKELPDTSHVMVLIEEISLAYARRLFDCGNTKGAFYYCTYLDSENGLMLKKELESFDTNRTTVEQLPPTNCDA